MSVARCYECSSCGGVVRETARECPYCRSPVATVRCARCFSMNVTEALHCLSCGSELGLMPVPIEEGKRLACPRCSGRSLDGFNNGETTLYDCSVCGGQFIRNEDLTLLVRHHEERQVVLPKQLRKHNPLEQSVIYLRCPACSVLMTRKNFGGISGVIVDVCALHGTWFDPGELARILAFVGGGGLALARRRELDEYERKAARLRVQASPQATGAAGPWFSGSPPDGGLELQDFEDAVMAFVRWVRRSLR